MKKPIAQNPSFDSQFVAEESSVRPSADRRCTPPRPTEGVGDRNARIEAKIRHAEYVLTRLAPTDHRLRLLCSAILRRDEVLLDAILKGKSGKP